MASPVLFWTPRILTLTFAAFLLMLAVDVFGGGLGFWGTLGALFLHLIPVVAVLALLAAAWRRSWIGAVAFVALGVLYFLATDGRLAWHNYAAISGTSFLLSGLFLADCVAAPRVKIR